MEPKKSSTIRSRKFMLTFQCSHIDAGWSHDTIKQAISTKLKGVSYYALCDEIGNETKQLHSHLILYSPNALRLNTLKNIFNDVHFDVLKGTMHEARIYLLKSDKFVGTDKAETSVEGTFEEHGDIPNEKGGGHRSDKELMMEMVRQKYSDLEIVEAIPSMVDKITTIQKYRQLVIEEQAHEFREMEVTYCYGKTGAGKTRGLYSQYADDKGCIYTINSYQGTGLFDSYDSSTVKVLALDEYRSQIPFGLLLALTDGQYQIIMSRYSNRIATHTKVWIISNISLLDQYPNIQQNEPESWKALLRRITTIRHYYDINKYKDYSVEDYLHAERYGLLDTWEKTPVEDTPFNQKLFPIMTEEQLALDLSDDSLPFNNNKY